MNFISTLSKINIRPLEDVNERLIKEKWIALKGVDGSAKIVLIPELRVFKIFNPEIILREAGFDSSSIAWKSLIEIINLYTIRKNGDPSKNLVTLKRIADLDSVEIYDILTKVYNENASLTSLFYTDSDLFLEARKAIDIIVTKFVEVEKIGKKLQYIYAFYDYSLSPDSERFRQNLIDVRNNHPYLDVTIDV